jgi:hypothetical protein
LKKQKEFENKISKLYSSTNEQTTIEEKALQGKKKVSGKTENIQTSNLCPHTTITSKSTATAR